MVKRPYLTAQDTLFQSRTLRPSAVRSQFGEGAKHRYGPWSSENWRSSSLPLLVWRSDESCQSQWTGRDVVACQYLYESVRELMESLWTKGTYKSSMSDCSADSRPSRWSRRKLPPMKAFRFHFVALSSILPLYPQVRRWQEVVGSPLGGAEYVRQMSATGHPTTWRLNKAPVFSTLEIKIPAVYWEQSRVRPNLSRSSFEHARFVCTIYTTYT